MRLPDRDRQGFSQSGLAGIAARSDRSRTKAGRSEDLCRHHSHRRKDGKGRRGQASRLSALRESGSGTCALSASTGIDFSRYELYEQITYGTSNAIQSATQLAKQRGGRISKSGDMAMRTTLYQASLALLTRSKKQSAIMKWGLAVAKRRGLRRAVVAVSRKLAIVLHRVWADGTEYRWGDAAA